MKKTIKKAKIGTTTSQTTKKPNTPTYKNLKMGVVNEYEQATGERRDVKATAEDSASYRRGYERGLKGGKEYPYERNIEKMGRWEGQNATKKSAAPKKKMKSGGSFPDLNKDGKITKADILKGRGVIAQKGATVKKPLLPAPKKKTGMDAVKALGEYVSTFGYAKERYNPAPSKAAKKTPKQKMGGVTKAKSGKCKYGCK